MASVATATHSQASGGRGRGLAGSRALYTEAGARYATVATTMDMVKCDQKRETLGDPGLGEWKMVSHLPVVTGWAHVQP